MDLLPLGANKTVIKLNLHFIIREKLYKIQCDKKKHFSNISILLWQLKLFDKKIIVL